MAEMAAAERVVDRFRLVGTVLADRFRIEREIAEGGFGVVYLGAQVALDRRVAIKVLKTPPGLDEAAQAQFREKFAAEAKTIARLNHPHIVDVYDFGISSMPTGALAPWMALEWLEGDTIEAVLSRRRGQGGMKPREVLNLLRPALQAFGYAHRLGIAHRDIKPANIMLSATDHGSVLRVLDFGIAKLMDADETAGTGRTKTSGMPAFSPAYAAPEQVAFGRTGPWTDVHALGLLLSEALTDQPPFPAEDMQIFEQIVATQRPTPASKGKDVGAWEPVLAKALALQPTQRWKDANELLAALDAALGAKAAPAKSTEQRAIELGDTAMPAGAARSPDSPPASRPAGRTLGVLGAVLAIAAATAAVIVYARRGGARPDPVVPAVTSVSAPVPVPAPVPAPAPVPKPVAAPANDPTAVSAPAPRPKKVTVRRRRTADAIEIE